MGFQWLSMAFNGFHGFEICASFLKLCFPVLWGNLCSHRLPRRPSQALKYHEISIVLNIACWIMVQDGSRIFNSQSHATRLCCRLKEAAASAGSIWGNVRQARATPRELVWDKLWQFTSGSFHSKTLLSRWRFGAHPCSCSTTAVATRESTRNLHHCPDLYSLYCLHTADTSETWLCTMLKRWNCWGFDISWRAPWLRPP